MFKQDLSDDSDGAHLTSFGIEFQTEEEAEENDQSPSVALLCAGLLRRGIVCVVERVKAFENFFCISYYLVINKNLKRKLFKVVAIYDFILIRTSIFNISFAKMIEITSSFEILMVLLSLFMNAMYFIDTSRI